MIIEIKGVNFKNKGAELMLHAILQKVKSKFEDVKFVMKPSPISPYIERAKLGVYQKLEFQKFNIELGHISEKLLPKAFRQIYGLVKEEEIDVILDASGLAYSDKWGIGLAKNSAKQFRRMKKIGTKIIMLPQAFGPFENPDIKEHIVKISQNTDLIFARDQISYEILTKTVGKCEHIKMAPDFTNLVQGTLPASFSGKEGSICIIPNYRMIDKTTGDVNNKYIPFLSMIVKELLKREEKVILLIHEGEQDIKLAQAIINESGSNIDIIVESNPLHIKGIISQSKGIVSSRFHGLVSALSQGVPALGTGWSHKYEMLYNDYDFDQGLLDVDMSNSEIKEKLNLLTDNKLNSDLSKHLLDWSAKIKSKSEDMWNEVFKILNQIPK